MFRIHDILVWIRIRIRGSMSLTYGSGFGSGFCYFRHWPSRCQQKTNFFNEKFCLLLFEGTFTSFFKDKKTKRNHTGRKNRLRRVGYLQKKVTVERKHMRTKNEKNRITKNMNYDKGNFAHGALTYVEYKTDAGMFKRRRMKTFKKTKKHQKCPCVQHWVNYTEEVR